MDQQKMHILILGGTNFMGKSLLDTLSHDLTYFQVHCINRGRSYWNNEVREQHPYFKHYSCNRNEHSDMKKMIGYLNEKLNISETNPWLCVIDFSAFKWRDVQSVVKPLRNKTMKYILISSDSLYNNCQKKLNNPVSENLVNIEQLYKQQKHYKNLNDSYGYNKLKCQLYLQRTKYVPFICLRLPDVIGPFDNTDRFWCYLHWLSQNNIYQIPLNTRDQTYPLSFVFSVDVANILAQLCRKPYDFQKYSRLEAYNLSFKENLSLQQLLVQMGHQIGNQNIHFKCVKTSTTNNFYPSTQFGYLDITQAEKQLQWKPTPIIQAIHSTVDFFMNHAERYYTQKSGMLKQFKRKIIKGD